MRKVPQVTKLILVALLTNSTAVAGTIIASHSLAETGSGTVLGNDTLIPIGVIVVLIGAAVTATWKLGRFFDRIDKFEARLQKIESKVDELAEDRKSKP